MAEGPTEKTDELVEIREAQREDGEWLARALEGENLRMEVAFAEIFTRMGERPRDRFDVIGGVATAITEVPDDPFAAAERYLLGELQTWDNELEFIALMNQVDADSDGLERGMKSLRVLVDAMNTEHFEDAKRLDVQMAEALKRTSVAAAEGAAEGHEASRQAVLTIERSARRAKRQRILALSGVAAVSFLVGELVSLGALVLVDAASNTATGVSIGTSFVVAVTTFALIDLGLVEGRLEPALRRNRRRSFSDAVTTVVETYRRAALRILAVRAQLERRDEGST